MSGSRSCSSNHFHSFVEAAKEILNHSIHMIKRWAMELLGYEFSIVHRPVKMVTDLDALICKIDPHFARHFCIKIEGADQIHTTVQGS